MQIRDPPGCRTSCSGSAMATTSLSIESRVVCESNYPVQVSCQSTWWGAIPHSVSCHGMIVQSVRAHRIICFLHFQYVNIVKIERFSFDPCDAILTQTASKVKTVLDKHISQTKSGKKKENLLDQPRVVEPTKENLLDQKRFNRPTPLSCASD